MKHIQRILLITAFVIGGILHAGGPGQIAYDGNMDGVADYRQDNVFTILTYDSQDSITVESSTPTIIDSTSGIAIPGLPSLQHDADFTYQFLHIESSGITADTLQIKIYLPDDANPQSFWQYGPTPENDTPHWYEFNYNGETGAVINGNIVVVHYIDGQRGDNDLLVNNLIQMQGGPGRLIYDGNQDGISDDIQDYVVSFQDVYNGESLTLETDNNLIFNNVRSIQAPIPGDTLYEAQFDYGFVDFTLTGMNSGQAVDVTLYLPDNVSPPSFWMYGPTQDNTSPHWYEFSYDGTTGAEITDNTVVLHFVDGLRGDNDLSSDGALEVSGGPGNLIYTGTEPPENSENVVSFHSYDGSHYLTLVSPYGTTLSDVEATDDPTNVQFESNGLGKVAISHENTDVEFPYGFVSFTLSGVEPDETTPVMLFLPENADVENYYHYGPTSDNPTPHWYEFMYDGQTGAEIRGNVVTLNFTDNDRGDGNVAETGTIKAAGGPGYVTYDGNFDGIPDSWQNNIVSFRPFNGADYITLIAEDGTEFSNVYSADLTSLGISYPTYTNPQYGNIEFNLSGLEPGESQVITLQFPEDIAVDEFYYFGPTNDNADDHWESFMHNGETGAEIDGNTVTLHFTDGGFGDADLDADGVLTVSVSPVYVMYDGNQDSVPDAQQDNVVSFHPYNSDSYLTIESHPETSILEAMTYEMESAPDGMALTVGCIDFTIDGLTADSLSGVKIYLPDTSQIDRWYIVLPDEDNTVQWEELSAAEEGSAKLSQENQYVYFQFTDNQTGDKEQDIPGRFSISIAPGTMASPGTGGALASEKVYSYPNPYNPMEIANSIIRYSLEHSADVSIKIYDAGTNLVRTLMEDVPQTEATEQSIGWDGKNGEGKLVANGIYFYVIETSRNERAVGKIAVIR